MPITLKPVQWDKLREKLKNDYKPSVILIRENMRKTLGFVDRTHTEWSNLKGYHTVVCLDFYSEPKRTMFLLKYSEYLDKNGITTLD
jgi:hypothetical protein